MLVMAEKSKGFDNPAACADVAGRRVGGGWVDVDSGLELLVSSKQFQEKNSNK